MWWDGEDMSMVGCRRDGFGGRECRMQKGWTQRMQTWWDTEGMDVEDVSVVGHRRDGHGGYERSAA